MFVGLLFIASNSGWQAALLADLYQQRLPLFSPPSVSATHLPLLQLSTLTISLLYPELCVMVSLLAKVSCVKIFVL